MTSKDKEKIQDIYQRNKTMTMMLMMVIMTKMVGHKNRRDLEFTKEATYFMQIGANSLLQTHC